jgi:hypothetical protein
VHREIRLSDRSRSRIRLASVAEAYALVWELLGDSRASTFP